MHLSAVHIWTTNGGTDRGLIEGKVPAAHAGACLACGFIKRATPTFLVSYDKKSHLHMVSSESSRIFLVLRQEKPLAHGSIKRGTPTFSIS